MAKVFKSIAISLIRSKDYSENVSKCSWQGNEPCFICGKSVDLSSKKTKWVQYDRNKDEITDYMGDIGSNDPEAFPVGSACFNKLRKIGKQAYIIGDEAEC